MAGAPGYVHISQRARTAAASQMAAAAGGAAPLRRRPGMRRPGAVEAGGAPQQVRADRRLNPQDPGVSSEARGFVLYVGLGEAKAAANGTTLVEIVQQLRRSVAQIAPEAESYAAVALAQAGAPGGDLQVVRNALGDPTAVEPAAEAVTAPVSARDTRTTQSVGVLIDLSRREVMLDGSVLNLTYKEFELLNYLVENGSRTVGRTELISSLWSDADETPNERTIDVHIRRLRSKLGRLANTVRTVRGQGYRFYDHPEVIVWAAPEYSI